MVRTVTGEAAADRALPGLARPRRFRPRFHYELLVCGLRGHELIGTDVAELRPADAIVLDLMLPGIDGFEVCRRIRDDGVRSPILMLTARDAIRDRVAGLDGGADDYLTKPFSYDELLARLRALARRGPVEHPPELVVGELALDPARRRVRRGDTEIVLSGREFAVLETFMRNPGRVLSRFELLEHVWEGAYENRSNVVDSYVRLLRRKIDRPFGTDSIETVRGAGYRLKEAAP